MDDWRHCLQRCGDVHIGRVYVDRDVGAAGKAGAWVLCPVVSTAERDSIRMVHPVEPSEHAAESVLLWLQLLLASEDLAVKLELFAFLRVDVQHLHGLLEHLDGILLLWCELVDVKRCVLLVDWLDLATVGDVDDGRRGDDIARNASVCRTRRSCLSNLAGNLSGRLGLDPLAGLRHALDNDFTLGYTLRFVKRIPKCLNLRRRSDIWVSRVLPWYAFAIDVRLWYSSNFSHYSAAPK